jgi:hypothetical protein
MPTGPPFAQATVTAGTHRRPCVAAHPGRRLCATADRRQRSRSRARRRSDRGPARLAPAGCRSVRRPARSGGVLQRPLGQLARSPYAGKPGAARAFVQTVRPRPRDRPVGRRVAGAGGGWALTQIRPPAAHIARAFPAPAKRQATIGTTRPADVVGPSGFLTVLAVAVGALPAAAASSRERVSRPGGHRGRPQRVDHTRRVQLGQWWYDLVVRCSRGIGLDRLSR